MMNLNDTNLPPSTIRDAVTAWLQVAKIVADKEALAVLADLQKASAEADAKIKESAQREAAVVEREEKSAEALFQAKRANEHAISTARDEHDRRTAEKEVAIAAREQRAAALLKQAEADAKKAADLKTGWERKMKAFEVA